MIFQYRAKNKEGENFAGLVESFSMEEATELLTERGLIIILLKEQKRATVGQLKFFARIKPKDLVVFFRQLAVMVSAAFPIVQALKTANKQTPNVDLKVIISEIADEVEGGNKLSNALAKYPKIFNSFFVNMIKIGESSGKLDEILNYLADQQEKDYDLTSRIKGAMIYPVVILTSAVVLGVFMMVFIIPKLSEVLKETGAPLPLPTRMLMGVSGFIINYWLVLIICLVGLMIFLKIYLKTAQGKKYGDYLKLKVPIFGVFFQKIYLIRFTRSLNILIMGGVPLTLSLKIVNDVVDNAVYQDLIKKTIKEVEDGNPISSIFLQSKIIPPMLSQMMDVGERTGRIDDILSKLSNFYDGELTVMVSNLMTAIEPIILIIMGVIVGLMVAAFILPMYNLAGSF